MYRAPYMGDYLRSSLFESMKKRDGMGYGTPLPFFLYVSPRHASLSLSLSLSLHPFLLTRLEPISIIPVFPTLSLSS
jgi:hypothetical protein